MNDLINIELTTPMNVAIMILVIIGFVAVVIGIAHYLGTMSRRRRRNKQEPISIPPNVAVNPPQDAIRTIKDEKVDMVMARFKTSVSEQEKIKYGLCEHCKYLKGCKLGARDFVQHCDSYDSEHSK